MGRKKSVQAVPGGRTIDELKQELLDFTGQDVANRRPVLTHINADTTWLLSIPYPDGVQSPAGRARFNIFIDPWLQGPQVDVASWFSTQWHAVKSSVETITELNSILAEIETSYLTKTSPGSMATASKEMSFIDLVVVSHEFTDHCHKATLLEISSTVPVIATTKAAGLIRSWKYFEKVIEMDLFSVGSNWHDTSLLLLPNWLGIARLITASNPLYFHSAVIIFIQLDQHKSGAEVVLYTPHGIEAKTISALMTANPPVQTLAFLHGLHDVSIYLTKQLNLGLLNALKAQSKLRAKYWIGTHDEVKIEAGVIAPFLRRKAYTIIDGLTNSNSKSEQEKLANEMNKQDMAYASLASGQSLILA